VIALHVAGDFAANTVMVGDGFVTAAADSFTLTLTGTGGHGAYPHLGTDPTFLLAQVLNAIHGIRARRVDPATAAVISVGTIHAGRADNVIPHEVVVTGTLRSYDDETRSLLQRELAVAAGVARALGGDFHLEIDPGYPATHNDPAVAALVSETARAIVGEAGMLPPKPGMGAEDFSYMSRRAPGAMFMLGAAPAGGPRQHHSPTFDIDEAVLPTGAAILAETACRLLERLAGGKL
jgi:amidohydrolase